VTATHIWRMLFCKNSDLLVFSLAPQIDIYINRIKDLWIRMLVLEIKGRMEQIKKIKYA